MRKVRYGPQGEIVSKTRRAEGEDFPFAVVFPSGNIFRKCETYDQAARIRDRNVGFQMRVLSIYCKQKSPPETGGLD